MKSRIGTLIKVVTLILTILMLAGLVIAGFGLGQTMNIKELNGLAETGIAALVVCALGILLAEMFIWALAEFINTQERMNVELEDIAKAIREGNPQGNLSYTMTQMSFNDLMKSVPNAKKDEKEV